MSGKSSFFGSSIGKKILMAGSGILLLGFVIAHMLGHLQMFQGQNAYNNYAKTLKDLGPLLWIARSGLLVVFLLHISVAIILSRENSNARPVGYKFSSTIQASFASRTMVLTGLLVLSFVIYHLMHFTLGITNPEHFLLKDSLGRPDVYSMFVLAFQDNAIAGSYFAAMIILGIHLSHGIFSAFQTLGLNNVELNPKVKSASIGIAILIVSGYLSVPIGIFAGIIKPVTIGGM